MNTHEAQALALEYLIAREQADRARKARSQALATYVLTCSTSEAYATTDAEHREFHRLVAAAAGIKRRLMSFIRAHIDTPPVAQ